MDLPAPNSRPSEDEAEREAIKAAIEVARRSIREGRGIPHEKMRAWLLDLAAGRRTTKPEP